MTVAIAAAARRGWMLAMVSLAALLTQSAFAEPYFAVREGLKCAICHVNPTGGGMRTVFGNTWAQTSLPQQRINVGGEDLWVGQVNRWFGVGGNVRADALYSDIPNQDEQSQFDLEEARAYLEVQVIPTRLSVYVDQRLAPGSSTTMEAWARYTSENQQWYVKAGQLYLPFGWRYEDDTTFVRQVSGINMNAPDEGVELGYETGAWSAQLAFSNGSAGGAETDDGKQVSVRAEHIRSAWRLGGAVNLNDTDAGDRAMYGVFAGVRTGPIAWLAEADYIKDESFVPVERKHWVGLLEGNWLFLKGHNLKLTAEFFEPDTDVDEDEQNRFSAVYEWFPVQFLQLRIGARIYDGIPQNDQQNRRLYFAQLHGYF